jgi:hypothetical protein
MLEHFHHFFETLAAIVAVIAAFLPWLWRWVTRITINYKFSKDMANNHLPHLYHGQRLIARKLGVDIPDDPPIHFVEINGDHK